MDKKLNRYGIIILVVLFLLFYFITTILLDRRNINKDTIDNHDNVIEKNLNYEDEKQIINNLYKDVRILYDVVNNKFTVSQDDTITIGNIVYKKITNFNEVMNNIFTKNGIDNYIDDMRNYFAYTENGYYLAGNLVSYQTYYFRGDTTNIYIISSDEEEINGIIYEKWTSNYKNTLATIKVVKENGKWLVDDINVLSAD